MHRPVAPPRAHASFLRARPDRTRHSHPSSNHQPHPTAPRILASQQHLPPSVSTLAVSAPPPAPRTTATSFAIILLPEESFAYICITESLVARLLSATPCSDIPPPTTSHTTGFAGMGSGKTVFYAIARGRMPGVYDTWLAIPFPHHLSSSPRPSPPNH